MGSHIAWSKRVRTLLAAGAIPATTISAIGDFFSPRGGWMLPIALGLLALAVLCSLLLIGTRAAAKVSDGDSDLAGWWDGPRASQLGVWVVATFAASALGFGVLSHARAAEGGVLGGHLGVVADAQRQLGLLTEIEANTGRTADATEAIRDTVKRETSDDPRKEISNRGQEWTEKGFLESIRREDLESVALYLEGGMSIDKVDNFVFASIYNRTYAHLDLFEQHGVTASRESCRMALFQSHAFAINPDANNGKPIHIVDLRANTDIDREAVRTYTILCSGYPDLAASILTRETCRKPDYACAADASADPSDPVATAMASHQQSRAACDVGRQRLTAGYEFCRHLLDRLD